MFYEIGKAFVLAARFNVSRAREVKKVRAEWRPIGLFPTDLDGANNRDQLSGVFIGTRMPDEGQAEKHYTLRKKCPPFKLSGVNHFFTFAIMSTSSSNFFRCSFSLPDAIAALTQVAA